MERAERDAIFLTASPHRGEEGSAGVIDGPHSRWDEAENRLQLQKAVMARARRGSRCRERRRGWDVPVVGEPAPDFTLPTDEGTELTLSALRGRPVVLYFYPKDDTSGCTTQACEFRDDFPRFVAGDAVILGVSPDSVRSHARFRAKYDLPFTLLADEDHAVAERYGVWAEKSMYGRSTG